MKVLLHPIANKFLSTIDKKISEKIKNELKILGQSPYSNKLNVKQLKGIDKKPIPFRLRLGEYRAIYFIEKDEIFVTDIFHREKGYKL